MWQITGGVLHRVDVEAPGPRDEAFTAKAGTALEGPARIQEDDILLAELVPGLRDRDEGIVQFASQAG